MTAPENRQITYLGTEDLLHIGQVVLGHLPPVRDLGLLSSAAARPGTVAFGQEAYPDLWHKAAALLHSLCQNHALIDGNKRLAWSAAMVFLGLNGVPIVDVDVDDAERFMLGIAKGEIEDVSEISEHLHRLLRF